MRKALLANCAVAVARGTQRLRPTDVDLWSVPLDEASDDVVDRLRTLLSADEAERAGKFYFERDRRRYIVGRGVLRQLLGRYLGRPASEVAFTYGRHGKPEVAHSQRQRLRFNIAHSEGLALMAFTTAGEVGVDVERIRDMPDWEYIASTCFSPAERALVENAPTALKPVEFFRAWTRQEARLKSTGEGLGGEVRWSPAAGRRGAATESDPRREIPQTDGFNPAFSGTALRVYSLQVAAGYAAALAIPSAARWATLSLWNHAADPQRFRAARRSRRLPLQPSAEAGIGFL